MATADVGFRDPDVLSRIGPTIAVQIGFDPSFHPPPGPEPELHQDLHPVQAEEVVLPLAGPDAEIHPGSQVPHGKNELTTYTVGFVIAFQNR